MHEDLETYLLIEMSLNNASTHGKLQVSNLARQPANNSSNNADL